MLLVSVCRLRPKDLVGFPVGPRSCGKETHD